MKATAECSLKAHETGLRSRSDDPLDETCLADRQVNCGPYSNGTDVFKVRRAGSRYSETIEALLLLCNCLKKFSGLLALFRTSFLDVPGKLVQHVFSRVSRFKQALSEG